MSEMFVDPIEGVGVADGPVESPSEVTARYAAVVPDDPGWPPAAGEPELLESAAWSPEQLEQVRADPAFAAEVQAQAERLADEYMLAQLPLLQQLDLGDHPEVQALLARHGRESALERIMQSDELLDQSREAVAALAEQLGADVDAGAVVQRVGAVIAKFEERGYQVSDDEAILMLQAATHEAAGERWTVEVGERRVAEQLDHVGRLYGLTDEHKGAAWNLAEQIHARDGGDPMEAVRVAAEIVARREGRAHEREDGSLQGNPQPREARNITKHYAERGRELMRAAVAAPAPAAAVERPFVGSLGLAGQHGQLRDAAGRFLSAAAASKAQGAAGPGWRGLGRNAMAAAGPVRS
jgi:hypothetical protein